MSDTNDETGIIIYIEYTSIIALPRTFKLFRFFLEVNQYFPNKAIC